MTPIVEEFVITLKYQVKVDTETGEMTSQCIDRKISKSNFEVSELKKTKKVKKEESPDPQLILEENKYSLNSAAIALMNVSSDDKLDIKYEKRDKVMVPVIGTDENFHTKGGNRLTKSNTVAFRGNKNAELAKYGDIFSIKPHEEKEGLFILIGNKETTTLTGDDTVNVAEEDIDLADFIEDNNVEEVDSSFFQL